MKDKDAYSLFDYNKIVENFHNESDRAAAVIAASFVEVFLEKLLRHFLRKDPIVDDIFEGYGPFSTFSSRSDVAYALRIIDKNIHRDLKFIRKVRNHFAHHPGEAAFDKSPVNEFCHELSTSQQCKTPRSMFLIAVGLSVGIMHNIMLANKVKSS